MKNQVHLSPVIAQLRIDHLSYFTNSQHLLMNCTTFSEGRLQQRTFRLSLEVFNNLLCCHPNKSLSSKLFAQLGENLMGKENRWEHVNIRACMGEHLIYSSIQFLEALQWKKNGEPRKEITGIISKKNAA